jgi:L-iditol 2-dehydrogenase
MSGVVVHVDSHNGGFLQGDRVTVIPLIPCRSCDYCQIGAYQLCEKYDYLGSRTNGAFAEYVVVPTGNLLRLPDSVSFETGAMTDPIAVALHAVRRAQLRPGDRVAVFGVGPIGLCAIQWAKLLGATQVFGVDIRAEKLQLAGDLGADVCIDNREEDPVEVIMHYTNAKGVECTIEFAGHPTTQQQCILATAKRGTSVWGGISHRRLQLTEEAVDAIQRRELVITGSWNSSFTVLEDDWKVSLRFLERHRIDVTNIITHRLPLDKIEEAFDMMDAQREYFNKVMFFPEM